MNATPTLLVVDIQNDYFPGGRHPLHEPEAAARNARRLLDAFREREWPVVHVQHIALAPAATFFLPETPGAAIHELVRPAPGEPIVVKHRPNSFLGTGLLETLRGAGSGPLVVVGMMSSMCIDATVRAASDLGFRVTVAEDACAAPELERNGVRVPAAAVHAAFMAALSGSYAEVVPTGSVLADSPTDRDRAG